MSVFPDGLGLNGKVGLLAHGSAH